MATSTAARDQWVVCADHAAGPYTARGAAGALARIARLGKCRNDHQVVTSATQPVTDAGRRAELAEMRAAWDEPFLAGPRDTAACAARGDLTRRLAAATLAAPLGTRLGYLEKASGGWSKATADRADAAAEAGSPAWYAALGPHETAVLTSDGRGAIREAWCRCPDNPAAEWVRYEAWDARGCAAHGFVCPSCRQLLQSG